MQPRDLVSPQQQHTLFALSPLDGRYRSRVAALADDFSEFGLIKYRVMVEIRWLQLLATRQLVHERFDKISSKGYQLLDDIVTHFSVEDAACVKKHEEVTNHDVKAVEYFIKDKIGEDQELLKLLELVHFGCTSEDINNLAYALMVKEGRRKHLIPALESILEQMGGLAKNFAALPMLARTHGQAATPTTLGKEFANFQARLSKCLDRLSNAPIEGKFNGATGNFNALIFACPHVEWMAVSDEFIASFGIVTNRYTTQIEPHDYLAEIFSILEHINTILLGFVTDIWSYCKDDYFKLEVVAKEVGSSTMPNKVNPIDFENAEGNLGIANAMLQFMSSKLPKSRLQRDLSDSTVLRNIGVALGYTIVSYKSINVGLKKLSANVDKITSDLNNHWEVLAEAIQTVMRQHGLPQPYERLKEFTRGKQTSAETLKAFITDLELPDDVKERLLALTPETYIGEAAVLATSFRRS